MSLSDDILESSAFNSRGLHDPARVTHAPCARLVDVWRKERRQARQGRRNPHARATWRDWKPPGATCINCGKPGPHFVPPSFGESGFYTCQST